MHARAHSVQITYTLFYYQPFSRHMQSHNIKTMVSLQKVKILIKASDVHKLTETYRAEDSGCNITCKKAAARFELFLGHHSALPEEEQAKLQ